MRALVLALCGLVASCGADYPCTPEAHCMDDAEPECEAGYDWENPDADGDFRCVPITTNGGSCPTGQERLADGSCAALCAADRERQGAACVCPDDTVELEDASCASTEGCPANAYRV